jgi:hypothetical protein
MSTFSHPNQFLGIWDGHWDGRRAVLEIDDHVGDAGRWLCNISLHDVDRHAHFRAVNVTNGDVPHRMRDVTLVGFRGTPGHKDVALLLLHTWNTDVLSGYSRWNGKEYGFSFARRT